LGLRATGGRELHERIEKLTGSLPQIDWRSVHMLADELQPAAAQQRFELFFELFLGHLARLIRAQAADEGTPAERELSARLIGEGRLASFAALWERVAREKAETVALNLDRKTLILDTMGGLVEAAQR
jgi:DNA polymerase-3 subunit delta'